MHKRNAQWDQTENYDSFVTGCDSRISRSSTITSAMIKYWLNVQLGLLVQRSIGIQGSAALGQVYVTYDTDDVVGYPVGINQPVIDANRYVKTNSNGNFSYSEINATIAGWIFDYFKNPDDISPDYTVVAGGANAPIAYDDDLTTHVDYLHTWNGGGAEKIEWEVSFSTRNISRISSYFYYKLDADPGHTITLSFQAYYAAAWHNILSYSVYATIQTTTIYNHYKTPLSSVTGLRFVSTMPSYGDDITLKIYDISVFS